MPAPHGTHAVPSAVALAQCNGHGEQMEEPATGANEAAGQRMQLALERAPTPEKYVPAEHGVHTGIPMAAAYEPLGHGTHAPVAPAAGL